MLVSQNIHDQPLGAHTCLPEVPGILWLDLGSGLTIQITATEAMKLYVALAAAMDDLEAHNEESHAQAAEAEILTDPLWQDA